MKDLKSRLLASPLGSLSKCELELLLLDFLICKGDLSTEPVLFSRECRITLSKAHIYLTELALRQEALNDNDAVARLIVLIKTSEVVNNGSALVFGVQDASLMLWLDRTLAKHGFFQGDSLRRDVVRLSVKSLAFLLSNSSKVPTISESMSLLRGKFGVQDWFIAFERDFEQNRVQEKAWDVFFDRSVNIASVFKRCY